MKNFLKEFKDFIAMALPLMAMMLEPLITERSPEARFTPPRTVKAHSPKLQATRFLE